MDLRELIKAENKSGGRLQLREFTRNEKDGPWMLVGTDSHGRRTRIAGTEEFIASMILRWPWHQPAPGGRHAAGVASKSIGRIEEAGMSIDEVRAIISADRKAGGHLQLRRVPDDDKHGPYRLVGTDRRRRYFKMAGTIEFIGQQLRLSFELADPDTGPFSPAAAS